MTTRERVEVLLRVLCPTPWSAKSCASASSCLLPCLRNPTFQACREPTWATRLLDPRGSIRSEAWIGGVKCQVFSTRSEQKARCHSELLTLRYGGLNPTDHQMWYPMELLTHPSRVLGGDSPVAFAPVGNPVRRGARVPISSPKIFFRGRLERAGVHILTSDGECMGVSAPRDVGVLGGDVSYDGDGL